MRKLLNFFVFSFCLFFGVKSAVAGEKSITQGGLQRQKQASKTNFIEDKPISWRDKAMLWTAKHRWFRFTKFFFNSGADVHKQDEDGRTVLIYAAAQGNIELIKLLLKVLTEVDINRQDKNGDTPLIYAAEYGDNEIVRLLLAAGADIDKQNKYGDTALIYAVLCDKFKVADLLIKAGADIDKQNKDGHTAQSYAAEYGRGKIIGLLLKARDLLPISS